MIINDDIITSRQNETVVKAAGLREKKYRDMHRLFLTDGIKLFYEAVESRAPIETIFLREDASARLLAIVTDKIADLSDYAQTRVVVLSESAFNKITVERSPEGIICIINYLDILHKYIKIEEDYATSIDPDEKIMLLSSIRDPGNMGTIIRSAVAFGIDRLILSSDCADIHTQRTVRGAMGALFKQKLDIVDDIKGAILSLKAQGRRIFAAAPHSSGYSLDRFQMRASDCIIIGNEANGIPPDIMQIANSGLIIPIRDDSESLNASVAASVFMWVLSQTSR
ncbi:MAG: RNA methyltransferase [Clostridiales bacterium]|nr:RNA methyltransferase [Clostridiales bacterium]